ncbi:zinc finger protein 845-like [Stegodyphus dumicola]|uniref:zinc finger protein 845-like n=1 Tax=Stegodyphus dumicola TaxID=202533 RepID=UPI0015B34C45|nr:zinc finger protein 845-like [Stegodyphus dumicola]
MNLIHVMKHTHNNTGEKSHVCDVCNKSFKVKQHLKVHKYTHTGQKLHVCDVCNKSFTLKSHLLLHMYLHTGEKSHLCDICNKSFSRKHHLMYHMHSHTGDKPYICDICGKSFSLRHHLLDHMHIHTGEKPHVCDMCRKSFARKRYLMVHMRTHTGEKPYVCDVCNKSFTQNCNLMVHKQLHTGVKSYICDVCKKSFTRKHDLLEHVRIHTGEKPHACDVCSKSFRLQSNLNAHMRSHTEEKPHICVVCNKSFKRKYPLVMHMRVHTEEKPHVFNIETSHSYKNRLHEYYPGVDDYTIRDKLMQELDALKQNNCPENDARLKDLSEHIASITISMEKDNKEKTEGDSQTPNSSQKMEKGNILIRNASGKKRKKQSTDKEGFVTPRVTHKRTLSNEEPEYPSQKNKFDQLNADDKMDDDNDEPFIIPKKTAGHIPPIVLADFAGSWDKLKVEFENDLNIKKYTGNLSGGRLTIRVFESDHYRTITSLLKKREIPFHTFKLKSEKPIKAIIKKLPKTSDIEILKQEILDLGIPVEKIRQITAKKDGEIIKLPVFLAEVKRNADGKKIFDIKKLRGLDVLVVNYKSKPGPVQCHKCQRYGHTRDLCNYTPRCLKCAENHETHLCKTQKGVHVPICVLCGENHVSSYRGCKKYPINIQNRIEEEKTANEGQEKADKDQFKLNPEEFPKLPSRSPQEIRNLFENFFVAYMEDLYACNVCKKLFTEEHHLVMHMCIHTGEKHEINDMYDKKLTPEISEVRLHMGMGEKSHVCYVCKKSCTQKSNLMEHMHIHTGEKSYACNVCSKSFVRKQDLVKHIRVHSGKKPYVCNVCNRTFKQKPHLAQHMHIHTGEKPDICDICNKSFTLKHQLVQHLCTHTGDKPYLCDVCKKLFTRKHHLMEHLHVHTGDKPHVCDVCNKLFTRKQDLRKHVRIHTGEKPHVCETCDMSFRLKQCLAEHMRMHTGEKPHVCDVCKKLFTRKQDMKKHMRIHTGEKPYTCNVCDKKFRLKHHLSGHMHIHTREKTDMYKRLFMQKQNLMQHMLINREMQS